MHCHSGLSKLLCKAVWFVTSIAAILWGLIPFGFDFWKSDFVVNNLPWIVTPALYLVGIAGILGLIGLFKHCAHKDSCPEETGRPYNHR